MDKIRINNMQFYGYHGTLEAEKSIGQRLSIDVEVSLDLKKPGNTDCLEDTIDYSDLYHIAQNAAENMKFNLMEALAKKIILDIQNRYKQRIDKVVVRVRKLSVLIQGIFDHVEIVLGSDCCDD